MSTPTTHTDVNLRLPEQGTDQDSAKDSATASAEAVGGGGR
jgi:hypothetical protein